MSNTGCNVCGSRQDLLRCKSCRKIHYCSVECQKIDWNEHQKTCIDDGHPVKVEHIDPIDPCPICLEEESTTGKFVLCLECGSCFCGFCIIPSRLDNIKCCPHCRDNKKRDEDEQMECLQNLLRKGKEKKKIYPFLAEIYRKKGDIKQCHEHIQQSIDDGCYSSLFFLAKTYETNPDFGVTEEQIYQIHRKAARNRIYMSQNWLGNYYSRQGNEEMSYFWHRKASENGCVVSMKICGDHNRGVDNEEAKKWYHMAGENHCCESRYELGDIHFGEDNLKDAFECFLTSSAFCDKGYFGMAMCYRRGYPKKCTMSEITMLLAGAELDNIDCINELGIIYLASTRYHTEDDFYIDNALKYLTRGVELGSLDSVHILAKYYSGIDLDKAVSYYEKAEQMGDNSAHYMIAKMYMSGELAPVNFFKTLFHLEKAKEQGYYPAIDILKKFYSKIG